MMIVINTQYRENYGDAHNPYWKYKGGTDIKVVNFMGSESDASAVVAKLRDKIEYSHDVAEEYIIGWSIQADDYMTAFEQDQILYDGEIKFPAPVFEMEY